MPTAAPDLHPHNRLAGSNGRDPTSWWRTAVIYQICVRSFADGNNDGVGDITGIRSRLPYLAELGVDAIWITPWYPSPMKDGGCDISDYRDVDPAFGTLVDADELLGKAQQLTGKGSRYLARVLGEAAVGVCRTDTFLGERYRRIAHRRGKKRAIVAVGRSILMIVWHLLSDDDARFVDLGSDYYESRVNLNRRTRNHVRELQALGDKVTLEPAA